MSIIDPDQGVRPPGGLAELTTILTPDDVRDLVERMLTSSGRCVDLSKPAI
jgi:hypothetical protein